jgi:hypothetical protein
MMPKVKTKLKPAKWQITATTIHCDLVDDFVTIMVNKDWSTKCAWYNRYKQKALDDKKQKFDRKIRLKIQKCQGPECSYVTGYRDELIKEEFRGK